MAIKHSSPLLELREDCGLAHDRQIVRIPWPTAVEDCEFVRERDSGALCVTQRSKTNPGSCFVEVALEPLQQLTLLPSDNGGDSASDSQCVIFQKHDPQSGVISNGIFSVEVPLNKDSGNAPDALETSGPVCRVRVGDGPWRGRTFFDSRRPVQSWRGELLEQGPLRVVYQFRAEFAPEGFYQATVTVDRGQPFAVVEEEFQAGSGDQVVWDFSGADLPEEFYLLDSTAAYQTRSLFYHFDQRLTRLMCWTQQSQHFDFSDGYAIGFAASSNAGHARDIAGFVALEGGTWRGAKLNHLEAWTRRWFPGDATSRRDVPFEAKADSQPGPDRIPARGNSLCEPHFNVEGWIGHGRRKWALVLTTLDKIEPADPSGEPLGHFERQPDRERYRHQQSLLRKIHTQRGILPLQDMIGMELAWDEEPSRESGFGYPHELLSEHFKGEDEAAAKHELMEYLAARVYGFWEGSGLAYTNPVASRGVAPEMFRYEWLARQGAFTEDEKKLVRAQFAFLSHLFASENCYAGDASMLPVDSPDSLDPTLSGMANQNFYTDVINVFGSAAQVFWKHPCAAEWRALFIERWHRQLGYHMYPESGVWEESHTYYHHVLHTVLPTFLRRRADGADDEFANPDFQKLVGAGLRQLTPRDAFFDDCRHVVIFGDHEVEVRRYLHLWREFAEAFAPHNRALAENLAWAYREMKGEERISVPAQAPELRNEHVQGLGVMFRGVDAAGQECLLALRSGNAWGHHHNDDGSIQFYAQGRALLVDAAFGGVPVDGHRKMDAAGHSRWTLKHVAPMNIRWRFNRGWITASALDGPLAFATCCSPLLMIRSGEGAQIPLRRAVNHFRTIVQITPAVYLVVDVSDADQDQSILFHVPGSENVNLEAGRADVVVAENCRLHLLPLLSVSPPQLAVDPPKNPAMQRFTTTALAYDIGREPFSAFLVAAERNAPPEMASTASGWTMRGRDFDVTLQRETPRRLTLTDQRAPAARTFDPWQR